MTKGENEKLMRLMRSLYPNDKAIAKDDAAAAWYLLLAPWDYETVRDAVLKFARQGRGFPPHADDIAAMLPMDVPAPDQDRDKVSETAAIENVAAWAAVMGKVMPLGLTAREAVDWFQERKMKV